MLAPRIVCRDREWSVIPRDVESRHQDHGGLTVRDHHTVDLLGDLDIGLASLESVSVQPSFAPRNRFSVSSPSTTYTKLGPGCVCQIPVPVKTSLCITMSFVAFEWILKSW